VTKSKTIKILLVDDEPLFRTGLADTIAKRLKQKVSFVECDDPFIAARIYDEEAPDLAIFDILFGNPEGGRRDKFGLQGIEQIMRSHPDAKIMVVSQCDDGGTIRKAFKLGIKTYVTKNEGTSEYVKAISETLEGREYYTQTVSAEIMQQVIEDKPFTLSLLDEREKEIVRLYALGHTNEEIAATVNLTIKTVRLLFQQIKQKTKIGRTQQLVVLAINEQLIDPNNYEFISD